MAEKDQLPEWVSKGIQEAEFGGRDEQSRTGYILEIYEQDKKADLQLYEPVEDGRHIVTVDTGGLEMSQMQRGVVYSFVFDQQKAPLGPEIIEYLRDQKGLDMEAIYQFELKGLEAIED